MYTVLHAVTPLTGLVVFTLLLCESPHTCLSPLLLQAIRSVCMRGDKCDITLKPIISHRGWHVTTIYSR